MKGIRASIRYAKSIYQLAQEQGILEQITVDIKLIEQVIRENNELELLLKSPMIQGEKKQKVLQQIFEGKIHALSLRMINQTISQGRENVLKNICEEYMKLFNTAHNIAEVSVTTAIRLDESLKKTLLENIQSAFHFTKIGLKETVDESLIGGMILRIGDRQLDGSIRRQLNDIKKELVHA